MKTLYLIRHGQCRRPSGAKRCLSRTDLPLDEIGIEQAEALGRWAKNHPIDVVYSSPACRCRETAAAISSQVLVREELWEVNVGQWENRTFEDIRQLWPGLYEARGLHMGTVAPPDGESFCEGGERLDGFLRKARSLPGDTVAVVAHGGLFRGWLWRWLELPPEEVLAIPQPWGGVTTISMEEDAPRVLSVGLRPQAPGPREIQALWERCGTPDDIRAHGEAVANAAIKLAQSEKDIDREMLRAAGMLHDLYRHRGRKHPEQAAELLKKEGWPLLAEVVAKHHDLGDDPPQEAELLYLADKLIQGTCIVPWKRRFQISWEKCTTVQAKAAWKRRYEDTALLAAKYGVI